MLYIHILPIFPENPEFALQLGHLMIGHLKNLYDTLKASGKLKSTCQMFTDGKGAVIYYFGPDEGVGFIFPGAHIEVTINDKAVYRKEVWLIVDRAQKHLPKYSLESFVNTCNQPTAGVPSFLKQDKINYSIISIFPEKESKLAMKNADLEQFGRQLAVLTNSKVKNYNICPANSEGGYDRLISVLKDQLLAEDAKTQQHHQQQVEFDQSLLNQLKQDTIVRVCDRYIPSTSYFSTAHPSRYQIIVNLRANLNAAESRQQIIDALVAAASDIRTPDSHEKLKYGYTFFRIHFGKYSDSTLYKLIDTQLQRIEPQFDLATASVPGRIMPLPGYTLGMQ